MIFLRLLIVTLVGHTRVMLACTNNGPLGMISGAIQDWQISASSSYPAEWDRGCHTKYARPYLQNRLGWCAHIKSTSEWLQIDLGVLTTVTGIITQGRGDGLEWVSSYRVSYSPDGEMWNYITDQSNNPRIFEGNTDSYLVQHAYLPEPIDARFVKIQVYTWNRHPSMRVELIGCQDNKQHLGQPPYGALRASTTHEFKKGSSCQPEDGHILSTKGWCAAKSDQDQWLVLDIGPPSLVTALETKGRGDTGRKQWVTKYRISYSNDSIVWQFYEDRLNLEEKYMNHDSGTINDTSPFLSLPNSVSADGAMEFGGNMDKDSSRIHYLAHPFIARYIRFHPVSWYREIAMRVAVMGRPHTGECGPGFTRPNFASPCVENIAFRKETWLNKERHIKRALGFGEALNQKLAEKAVDGILDNDIKSCTILDNHYDDEPQLTIDLGTRRDVSGIVVYMWQGQNDKSDIYNKEYALNLDSISVYISGKNGEELCGTITNSNNELLHERIHKLTCTRRIDGKYIRIQPNGKADRWSRWYSAVICEVMAFT